MSDNRSTKIDFKKYRTPELFEALSSLIDWRGTILSGYKNAMFGTLAIDAITSVLLCTITYLTQFSDWRLMLLFGIVLIAGVFCACPGGIFYSIAYFISRSLDNMLKVVDLLLETTKKVARDMDAVRTGESEMPTAKELVQGVYLEVFLPIIEKVISDQLSIFARPALFLYRLTFGRLMRLVIKILPERGLEKLHGSDLQETADAVTGAMVGVAATEPLIVAALDWTQKRILKLGRWAKFLVLLPCYAICAFVVLTSVLSMASVWYVASTTIVAGSGG